MNPYPSCTAAQDAVAPSLHHDVHGDIFVLLEQPPWLVMSSLRKQASRNICDLVSSKQANE
jgi:hypothetical protein